jgi:hypothetical protein
MNTQAPPVPAPRQYYTVHSPHFSQAPLSGELADLDLVARTHLTEDFDRFVDLIIARQVVPVSPLDRVEVIEDGLTAALVRTVDGDEAGREGWVPSAWLQPSSTATVAA